uniref:Uncharacterized protein n=1 Tax=Parascaris equorum TaxID=6256 RepID=A0A914S1H9_PAREQ
MGNFRTVANANVTRDEAFSGSATRRRGLAFVRWVTYGSVSACEEKLWDGSIRGTYPETRSQRLQEGAQNYLAPSFISYSI